MPTPGPLLDHTQGFMCCRDPSEIRISLGSNNITCPISLRAQATAQCVRPFIRPAS